MTTETPTAAAARLFDIKEQDITSPSRIARHVEARQALAYVLRAEHWSLKSIGALLGGRDHNTIFTSVAAAERKRATDANFAVRVQALAVAIKPAQSCCCATRLEALERRIAELEARR